MNLIELKGFVDNAIENTKEHGEDPIEVVVSIQIDDTPSEALWSEDIELTYDGNGQASGCVLHGWSADGKSPLFPSSGAIADALWWVQDGLDNADLSNKDRQRTLQSRNELKAFLNLIQ